MKLETNDLSLFGYDLTQAFAWGRMAWTELLWGSRSPILKSFEEPVRLYNAETKQEIGVIQNGKRVSGVGKNVQTVAVCLPEEQLLSKTVQLPVAIESDLAEVMHLELAAISPFPEEDSVMGWRLEGRDDTSLTIEALIAHKSDCRVAMASISGADELWAQGTSAYVVMGGFNEAKRKQRYISRLRVMAVKALLTFMILLALPAVVSGFRYLQMEKVKGQYLELKDSSAAAVEARETLMAGNELVDRFNTLIAEHPEPSYYLQLLTKEAADDVWLRNFNLKGSKLQITGYALNATEFIQQLSQLPQFSQVKQRGGIRRDNASGREVFTLDIVLAPAFAAEELKR